MNEKSAPRDPADPKGLIRESFRIDGITAEECRSIFVDWALSTASDEPRALIETLLARHEDAPRDHPMRGVLREGLAEIPTPRRRGGRAARMKKG